MAVVIPSPQEISYMLEHASDDLRPNVIVCVSVCALLATVFVSVRLYARWLGGGALLLADWLIIISLGLYVPMTAMLALCAYKGLGKHIIWVIQNARLLQIYYISAGVFYSVVVVTVKWSILAFYFRIFPQRWFRRILISLAIFMGGWMVTNTLGVTLQCQPFAYNWDKTIPGGHCIDIGQFGLITNILNGLTDLAILILPLPVVSQLHMTRQKRRGLLVTFALGGCACIVAIIRVGWIGRINHSSDPSWDNVPLGYMSTIEVMTGFLVACIPSYPILFLRAAGKTTGNRLAPSYTSAKKTPGTSGFSSSRPSRRRVVSWNQITNTDDIELVSPTTSPFPLEAVPAPDTRPSRVHLRTSDDSRGPQGLIQGHIHQASGHYEKEGKSLEVDVCDESVVEIFRNLRESRWSTAARPSDVSSKDWPLPSTGV